MLLNRLWLKQKIMPNSHPLPFQKYQQICMDIAINIIVIIMSNWINAEAKDDHNIAKTLFQRIKAKHPSI